MKRQTIQAGFAPLFILLGVAIVGVLSFAFIKTRSSTQTASPQNQQSASQKTDQSQVNISESDKRVNMGVKPSEGIGTILARIYPPSLVIGIHQGKASVNLPEPITITIPISEMDKIIKLSQNDDALARIDSSTYRLLVIDTSGNPANFLGYKSLSLLTRSYFTHIYDGKILTYPLSSLPDGEITQEFIANIDKQSEPLVHKLPSSNKVTGGVGTTPASKRVATQPSLAPYSSTLYQTIQSIIIQAVLAQQAAQQQLQQQQLQQQQYMYQKP